MKRPILSMLLSVLLLLPGCTQAPSGSSQEEGLTVLATTYPVYLFARTVAQGVEGVTVERLNTGSVSCLHDYTLSVDDMKKIEGADVIAMNGAGLEDFMDDALAAFDDGRMALALDLLAQLAEDRQILLFTCQSREAACLSGRPEVTIQSLPARA